MTNFSKNHLSNLVIIGFILIDLYLIVFSGVASKIALSSISLIIFISLLFFSKHKSN